MSTRERLPFAIMLVFSLLFCAGAASVFFFASPYDTYIIADADAGMRRNASAQTICAHLNTTAGADHVSGTVDTYYHNDSSFVSLGTATHQNLSAGIWCIAASADATNYDLVKILWKSTGAVTLLQTYPTTGYNDNDSTVAANVTKVNGTTQTAGDIMGHLNSTTYGLSVIHGNTSAISAAPTVEQIDAELSEKHGPGPWAK